MLVCSHFGQTRLWQPKTCQSRSVKAVLWTGLKRLIKHKKLFFGGFEPGYWAWIYVPSSLAHPWVLERKWPRRDLNIYLRLLSNSEPFLVSKSRGLLKAMRAAITDLCKQAFSTSTVPKKSKLWSINIDFTKLYIWLYRHCCWKFFSLDSKIIKNCCFLEKKLSIRNLVFYP